MFSWRDSKFQKKNENSILILFCIQFCKWCEMTTNSFSKLLFDEVFCMVMMGAFFGFWITTIAIVCLCKAVSLLFPNMELPRLLVKEKEW